MREMMENYKILLKNVKISLRVKIHSRFLMRKLIALRSEISDDCGGGAIGEKRELAVTLEIDKGIPHWVKWDLIKIE